MPPGYFRAAAGNLVREDDPLAVAFRRFADRVELGSRPGGMYFDIAHDDEPMTNEHLERLRAEWERARHGRPRVLTPLPRRVRLRLAAASAVDRAAIWLVNHGQLAAAELLWRAFGMWGRRS